MNGPLERSIYKYKDKEISPKSILLLSSILLRIILWGFYMSAHTISIIDAIIISEIHYYSNTTINSMNNTVVIVGAFYTVAPHAEQRFKQAPLIYAHSEVVASQV